MKFEWGGGESLQPVKSLYIHWPFCPYRCHFCPFVALAGHDSYIAEYHKALLTELESFFESHPDNGPIQTVFFGGGTPSTYPEDLLEETITCIKKRCGLTDSYEMTIEVNPGTVTPSKLHTWKQLGINRLSIGVQSLNDELLKNLNRHQKAADVYALLDAGSLIFDNLSVDLIIGLPGVSAQEWKKLVSIVSLWPIKHVSMYFLTVHEDTQLYFGVQSNKIVLPPDDEVVDLYYWTIDQFSQAGLEQYEISNFGRQGWESQHNRVYWHRKPYKGFGLGACSFDGASRFQNEKNLLKYIKGAINNDNVIVFAEKLTENQIWLEQLMLGLRQIKGIALDDIVESLSVKGKDSFYKRVYELESVHMVNCENGRIALTPHGLSVANEIIVKLSCIDNQ
ncbi:radical SAM family heme chaperone HemW [Candidatus Dependentiae bacterium]|nr:radical SAM family heme chaperone HemW [Candidatus Dependentiae bacterium]